MLLLLICYLLISIITLVLVINGDDLKDWANGYESDYDISQDYKCVLFVAFCPIINIMVLIFGSIHISCNIAEPVFTKICCVFTRLTEPIFKKMINFLRVKNYLNPRDK